MSGTAKTLKWGTIFTFVFGKAAIPMLVPVLIAMLTFIGVIIGVAPHAMEWINEAKDATEVFIAKMPN
jgi:hypothetical protein